MNKKQEEKILDEIRRRTLAADRERREKHEHEDELDVHLDVLDEMTALSRKEIDDIERKVRTEFLETQKKRRKIAMYAGISLLIVAFIGYRIYVAMQPPAMIIVEETFDDNSNSWDIFDEFEYKRFFENGNYMIETNVDGWCYWDDVRIEFPKNFDVEVQTQWLGGQFAGYGFSILESDRSYFAYSLKADGGAAYGKVMDGEWVIDEPYQPGKAYTAEKNYENVQLLKVRDRKFEYFVNGQLVLDGVFDIMPKFVGLRSCGEQKIAFQYLSVKNADNKLVLFEDDFVANNKSWNEKVSITKQSSFENGFYKFTSGTSKCYWTNSATLQIDENSTVELRLKWLEGERGDFGLMIMLGNADYAACEIKNDGSARLIISENGEYTSVPSYTKTNTKLTGNNSATIKAEMKDNLLKFYLDDYLVDSYQLPFSPTYIGVRVCEKQSVAFEHLTISRPEK